MMTMTTMVTRRRTSPIIMPTMVAVELDEPSVARLCNFCSQSGPVKGAGQLVIYIKKGLKIPSLYAYESQSLYHIIVMHSVDNIKLEL